MFFSIVKCLVDIYKTRSSYSRLINAFDNKSCHDAKNNLFLPLSIKASYMFERLETLSPRHDGDYCHPSYPNICIIYYATITTILHNGARGEIRNFKGGREVENIYMWGVE